jgi:hypothetical protein
MVRFGQLHDESLRLMAALGAVSSDGLAGMYVLSFPLLQQDRG